VQGHDLDNLGPTTAKDLLPRPLELNRRPAASIYSEAGNWDTVHANHDLGGEDPLEGIPRLGIPWTSLGDRSLAPGPAGRAVGSVSQDNEVAPRVVGCPRRALRQAAYHHVDLPDAIPERSGWVPALSIGKAEWYSSPEQNGIDRYDLHLGAATH
jgi:hypothetical protein